MKKRMSRLLALLLTLAMLLPSVLTVVPVKAEEAVTELPTETQPVTDQVPTVSKTVTWDFSDAGQLEDFSLYQSGTSALSISGGVLCSNGTDGEMKAILKDTPANVESLSVNIIPGASGLINVGLYFGASNAADALDAIQAQTVLIKSDYSGWTDAANRIDIVRGEFNNAWKHISTTISETGNGNNLFTGGVKQPLNLKLTFSDGVILVVLSLVSDPSKYVQLLYEIEGTVEGDIGLRVLSSDAQLDDLTVTYGCEDTQGSQETPDVIYVNQGTLLSNAQGVFYKASDRLRAVPYTVEAWVKVPKGVHDGVSGMILNGNVYYGAPYVALQMIPYGGLQLIWAVENEDLTTNTAYYNAEVDIRTGQWTHVAYTCDAAANKVVCYVNGEAVQTWENAGLAGMTTADHIIVDNEYALGNNLPGWVADVRMWDRALSADELKDSMMTQYTTAKDGLMLNVPLDELVSDAYVDLSGNGNNLTLYSWHTQELAAQTHEPGAYSIVVIPDQQILTNYAPEKLNQMYQWIADNREKENIQMVLNVGDMADVCGNITQWERNRAAVELLPDDLPFIAVPGNHDYDTNSGWDRGYGVRSQLTLMNEYLPRSLFESYPTEIGFFDEVNSANQWQTFEVNGNHYLVLALEYVPQADVVAWANEVVESHPYHQVMMITHSYMKASGNLSQPYLWNDFVKQHENIIMTFSGHVSRESITRRMDTGIHGNVVHQMLLDVQHYGSLAMLGILRFNADGTQCDVSYYSTEYDMYETGSNATLTLPKPASPAALVGADTYSTVTEAIANADGKIVKILKDINEEITVSTHVTIDLAGYTLSNVTVSEGASLMLIDSTADYTGSKGAATVTGAVERFTVNGDDKYMVIGENDVYTPHKYYVGITHVSLDTSVTGFGYKAGFYGDAAIQAQITNIGYDLWLTEDRVVSRSMDKFQNVVTLRLKNFDVVNYGETPVGAKAFITLVDGTKLESAVQSYSMRSMIELLNDSAADFEVAQLQNVAMFIKQNPVMEGWNVANILAILQPTANTEAITVKDQSMTLVNGTTDTFTLSGAYQFTAQDTEQTVAYSDYADWTADYYITMDAEVAEGLYLAGNYGSYGWVAMPVEAGYTYTNVPVVQTIFGNSLTYKELITDVGAFRCGVADTLDANGGTTVTVELRLTNPENTEEYLVLAQTSEQLVVNLGDNVISHWTDPANRYAYNSDGCSWTKVDSFTMNPGGCGYVLDNTTIYSDISANFRVSNITGSVATAGLLFNATSHANNGLDGYLVHVNTDNNFLLVYYLKNAYCNDGTEGVFTQIASISLNKYGISAEDTVFIASNVGNKLYLTSADRWAAGQSNLAAIDLTQNGQFALYENGHVGVLSWGEGGSFDFELSYFMGQQVEDTNLGDNVIGHLLNPATRNEYNYAGFTMTPVDDFTANVSGYGYGLDNTTVYSNMSANFEFGNPTGSIATAGILFNATSYANNGLDGYLIHVDTAGNTLQVYYLQNAYNTDGSAARFEFVASVSLTKYGISAADTIFILSNVGNMLYINSVGRWEAGQNIMAAIDLTKKGSFGLYEKGHIGVLSWAESGAFDFGLSHFTGTIEESE